MSSNQFAPQSASTTHGSVRVRRSLGWIDALLVRLIGKALGPAQIGCLKLTLPSGCSAAIGVEGSGVTTQLTINNYNFFWKCWRRGPLGFAEAYMADDVSCADLKAFFNYYMDNEPKVIDAVGALMNSAKRDIAFHSGSGNTRIGSRRNIAAHYDLGNAFYRQWLDAGMTYSSGIFAEPGTTLEEAQQSKYDAIIEALDLKPHQRVLEIGCGWGGFVAAAAASGAEVTAITISEQQFSATRERIVESNIGQQATVLLEDYRDTAGMFDCVASIEMIEAVGEEHWATYFQTISDRLTIGGKAVIQAITIRPDLYDGYRRNPDFMQRYIFPGGMLPTEDAMRLHAEKAGLSFEKLQTFGQSYAFTLIEWRRRFDAAWSTIAGPSFDERFRRMWSYYLIYCEVGFERGSVNVGLYRFIKKH